MKFETLGEKFAGAVQQVSRARSKSGSDNLLQDIYIALDNHILTLRTTNLEIFCERSVPVKGIHNGSCILNGETFVKVLPFLQDSKDPLTCEIVDGLFRITTPRQVIDITLNKESEFPALPSQGDELGTLQTTTLTTLLKEVVFCAAQTEIKPEISSVFLYSLNDSLYGVATDSYRLAEKSLPNTSNVTLSVLLPQKFIPDLLSILSSAEDMCTLHQQENILTISTTTLTVCVHVVRGQFPDYRQLFPREFTTTASLPKEDLQKALTLTTLFTEQYSQVKCVIAGDSLVLYSKNEKSGQATNTLAVVKEGNDIEAEYNNRYFLDVFPHITGSNITCSCTSPQRPMFITSKEDTSFTYLLMPLNR